MKIKEVQAGVKISSNYNSYQMNLVADVVEGESIKEVGEILIEKALEVINKKMGEKRDMNLEENDLSEIEVGAAWPHKKSSALLSVKMSKEGLWEQIKISDLEKIYGGYKQKTKDGVLIFRRIPENKRKNNKMPMFRIYQEVKNE